MTKSGMKSVLQITKALADRQRVRMLLLLQGRELCVCQVIAVLDLAPSTISKHLSILSAAEAIPAHGAKTLRVPASKSSSTP